MGNKKSQSRKVNYQIISTKINLLTHHKGILLNLYLIKT